MLCMTRLSGWRLCRPLSSPHHWDCPLAQSNEIILGEVMLKMNHLLPIPWRHGGHISLGPCTPRPSILQHHAGAVVLLITGTAHPHPATPNKSTWQGSLHLIQSWAIPVKSNNSTAMRNIMTFPFWVLIHLRLKFCRKLLQPRSSYCLAR